MESKTLKKRKAFGQNRNVPKQTNKRKKGSPKKPSRPPLPSRDSSKEGSEEQQTARRSFSIVGIGASAGGLEAFTQLLRHLPADTGLAFVLVQHLDPFHESILPELLARSSSMPVSQVANDMPVLPNHVYVIPPNTNMAISEDVLKLLPRKKEQGPHRSIDSFLTSLAEERESQAIGVILSGTASDGTLGLEEIKARGGITFAQDERSAKFDSMPRSAVAAGCVDFVLPPDQIAREIARLAQHSYTAPAEAGDTTEGKSAPSFQKILRLLRKATGVDFSPYKPSTIQRRISRRSVLHKLGSMEEYAEYLRDNRSEAEALYRDCLIHVTDFFRSPEAFESLKKRVFPKIIKQGSRDEPVRVWVVGCSTGEEVYSIAISWLEFLENQPASVSIQIFASDLNEKLVEKARLGLYPKNLVDDISPERLRRFFVEVEGGFQIDKQVREMCVFSRQNVLVDPPFSKIDLISCRNVLIYLEPVAQKKIVPILHFALKPTGFLLLGPSESLAGFSELFATEDKKHKIFSKKAASVPVRFELAVSGHPAGGADREGTKPKTVQVPVQGPSVQAEADRMLLAKYVPAAVLVNSDMEILLFRGSTDPYLKLPSGRATHNLLKMAREGLLLPLRASVAEARKQSSPVRREGLQVKANGATRDLNIQVIPLKDAETNEQLFWVAFEPVVSPPRDEPVETGRKEVKGGPAKRRFEDRERTRLRQELAATKEYLQTIIEQQEAYNEELQSANEEIQSNNEELQSLNEELETSKEELQSANEELITLNEELNRKNSELTQLNNDLVNLLSSINIPVVMLSSDLRIRRYTSVAEEALNLIPTDVGRPISDLQLNVNLPNLPELLADVIDTVTVKEEEVQDPSGRWHLIRLRPYMTVDKKIDGALMLLVDIDALKRSEKQIKEAREYAEAIVDSAREPILVLNEELRVNSANRSFYNFFKVSPEETKNRLVYELGNRQWDIPRLRSLLEEILPEKEEFQNFEVSHEFPRIGQKTMLLNARRLQQVPDRKEMILLSIEDITERKRFEEQRTQLSLERQARETAEAADRMKDNFLAVLSHELRTPLNAVVGWTRLLRAGKIDPAEFDRTLSIVERNALLQAQLIDDLLDISRIAAGKLRLEIGPVELAPVIEEAIATARPSAEAKGVRLDTAIGPEPVLVSGDRDRLQQVVCNLLSNAIKFSPKRGRIEVRLERVASEARIIVSDTGCGITPDLLPHIFERFRQADSTRSRVYDGLGVGLSIVRHLVELHGGRVEAESGGKDQGATFTVALPLMEIRADEHDLRGLKPAVPVREAVLEGKKVLLVEDDPDSLELLSVMLKHQGIEVKTCVSAHEALEAVEQWKPDIVVSDVGLPQQDGYELMKQIRALEPERGGRIPAIALTGYAGAKDRQRAFAAGYQAHLSKPVDPVELAQALARLVRPRGDAIS